MKELLKDRQYGAAAAMLGGQNQATVGQPAHARAAGSQFKQAVDFLVKQGVRAIEAETKSNVIADAIAQDEDGQLDRQFELA